MSLYSLYQKIALLHPKVEVLLRKLYWNNIHLFKRFNPYRRESPSQERNLPHVDFERVIEWYKSKGIGKGDLLIVHSSYDGLYTTGLAPEQIIDKLLDLVGSTGTLAMPVIRSYKNEPKMEDLLKVNTDDLVCTYDVKHSRVSSGLLPYLLMRCKGAVISHHPYNPLCAVGPLATEMMKHNLDGEYPSPHGPNSSWKFAYDHNCKVVSLGTDIEHHNTIMHINEEAFEDWHWSKEQWFRHRKFIIVDENKHQKQVIVSERKPEWGMLHHTDIRLNHDLKKQGIIQVDKICGEIEVGYVDVTRLVSFLRERKNTGYPYYA